jgi:WW domain-containing oxidoreductase
VLAIPSPSAIALRCAAAMGLKCRLASVWPIGELTGWAGRSSFGSLSTADEVLADIDLRGRVIIVTGATSGLGKEAARALASRGAHVIIPCRSLERGRDVAAWMGGTTSVFECDLASLASVRSFAAAFLDTKLPLSCLLCNAGLMPGPFQLTVDGHESMFGVNVLSHALLCDLLIPHMRASALLPGACAGRIVFVSSIVHHLGYPGGFKADVDSPEGFVAWKSYSQSKLAQILLARQMDDVFQRNGDRMAAFSVHPGAVHTQGSVDATAHSGAAGGCLTALGKRFVRSVQQGAGSLVFAAAHPQLEGARGSFICNANLADGHASKLTRNASAKAKLWTLKCDLLAAANAPADTLAAAEVSLP